MCVIFQVGWFGQAAQFIQDRVQVDQFYRRGAAMIKGTAVSSIVVGGFAPQAVLAQMKAGAGGKHDDGAVPQTKPIQFVKDTRPTCASM